MVGNWQLIQCSSNVGVVVEDESDLVSMETKDVDRA